MKQNRIGMVLALVGIVVILAMKNTAGVAQKRLKTKECGNQMIRLSFASMMWMQQNESAEYPEGFVQMFDLLGTPKTLRCPSDKKRHRIYTWEEYEPNKVSYVVIGPGVSITNTNAVFVQCPIHGNVIRADGFVYDREGKRLKRGVW